MARINLLGHGKIMQAMAKILAPCDIYDDRFSEISFDSYGNRLLPSKEILKNAESRGNSVLGMQFRTCKKFWESADFSPALSQNFLQTQKPHRNHFDCDSLCKSTANQTQNAESTLDSVKSQNLGENISSLRADSQNLRGKPPIEKIQKLQGGLPRSLALSRNDEFNGLPREQSSLAMTENKGIAESANKAQQTIEGIAVEVAEFLGDFGCETGLKSAKHSKSPKSPQDARMSKLPTKDEFGICLAIKTHIGILSNGTIVPCCIDTSGILALGNIKENSIDSALKSARAQKMLQGFRENRLVEHFCQKCDYKNRFT